MTLRLYIYIKDEPCSFPIFIQSSEMVGELKKAISEKVSDILEHVNTRQLVLYQVSLPDDGNLEQ